MKTYPGAAYKPLGPQTEPRMTGHDVVCLHTMVGYLSSTGVYGDAGGALVDESAAIGSGAWLAESQLPTSLDADLARWLVAGSVGVGLGVGGFSAWRLIATRAQDPIATPLT